MIFIIGLATAAGAGWLYWAHRAYDLSWAMWASPRALEKRRCDACDACGVQMLTPAGWGIIPRRLRTFNHGEGNHFQPKLANIRTCPRCHGKGFDWAKLPVVKTAGKES